MNKSYSFYTPYRSPLAPYPKLSHSLKLSDAFTSVVPSALERSVAYNMANPVPFQPPAHLKKMFEDADAALGDFLDDQRMQYFEHTLNKCGKASRCLVRAWFLGFWIMLTRFHIQNNLKPYFSQFCLIDEMYSMFPRFNTKMEKFKAAHAERLQAKFPAAVRRTMSSFEDLKKERTRALANAASKNHDARAQSGIEPESTKANEPKVRFSGFSFWVLLVNQNRPDSHYQDYCSVS